MNRPILHRPVAVQRGRGRAPAVCAYACMQTHCHRLFFFFFYLSLSPYAPRIPRITIKRLSNARVCASARYAKCTRIHSFDKSVQLFQREKHDGAIMYVHMHLTDAMCVQLSAARSGSCLSHRAARTLEEFFFPRGMSRLLITRLSACQLISDCL